MHLRQKLPAALAVIAAAFVSANLLGRTGLHLVTRAVGVFIITKLAGDLGEALTARLPGIIFYEDFLRDLLTFVILGLVTAGAIAAGRWWTGTEVSPALPAVGAYLFLLLVPPKRRGMGNEPY